LEEDSYIRDANWSLNSDFVVITIMKDLDGAIISQILVWDIVKDMEDMFHEMEGQSIHVFRGGANKGYVLGD
jgi:hypothetical protein